MPKVDEAGRRRRVRAQLALSNAVLDCIRDCDLSFGELLSFLAELQATWAGYLAKDERDTGTSPDPKARALLVAALEQMESDDQAMMTEFCTGKWTPAEVIGQVREYLGPQEGTPVGHVPNAGACVDCLHYAPRKRESGITESCPDWPCAVEGKVSKWTPKEGA